MKSLRMLRFGAFAAALIAGALPASADLAVKDGSGNLQTLCTTTFSSPTKHAYCHYLVDVNGVAFGTLNNPFHVTLDGASLTIGTLPPLAGGTATIGSLLNISGTISLPTGASTAAAQANQLTQETTTATALGTPADTAYAGSGSASHTAALKGIYAQLALILAGNGTTTDAAFGGSGSASEVALLKGVYAQIGLLLTQQTAETLANGGVTDTAYAGTGSASEIAALKGVYAQLGLLISANGTSADAAYTGSGNASQIAALKGVFAALNTLNTTITNDSVASGALGGAPANGATNIGFVQIPAGAPPVAVTPNAGELHLGAIGGDTLIATGSFVRPANTTAYAVGQIVANSTTAGSVVPVPLMIARKVAGTGRITRVRLSNSNPAAVNAVFRLHFFRSAPTTTAGDGIAFAGAVNGVTAVYLGSADVTLDKAFSDGAKGIGTVNTGAYISFDTAAGSQTLYVLVEARSAYTPTSGETVTVAAEADRD